MWTEPAGPRAGAGGGKMMKYTLLLESGRVVDAFGQDPDEASHIYANSHPGETVIAWRNYRGPGEIIPAIPIEASPQAR